MSEQLAYNIDCMEYMKALPDKYFDLAVVDPPYGGGAKADANESFNGSRVGRFSGHFDKYLKTEDAKLSLADDGSQSLNVEREREKEREAARRRGRLRVPQTEQIRWVV